jgi:hypothetical protein
MNNCSRTVHSLILLLVAMPATGEEPPVRPAKGIQDNSFLVEEAYNQESGVVQHILNVRRDIKEVAGPDDRDWHFAFTQEWPLFSQRHQLSYTVPYSFLESGGQTQYGVGDVLLNYRLQALFETDTQPAMAPRMSLVLPTGNESKGLGDDAWGLQFNLPFSKVVQDRWTLHANAGLTFLADVQGRNPVSYNLGGSAIYAVTPRFNLMLELVGGWNEQVNSGRIERDFEATMSPGVRYAFNFRAGQLVLGVGAPIGLTKAAPDYGAIFYLSFEHRFTRQPD